MSGHDPAGSDDLRRPPFDLGGVDRGVPVHLWLTRIMPQGWGGQNAYYRLTRQEGSLVTSGTVTRVAFEAEDERGGLLPPGTDPDPLGPVTLNRHLNFGEVLSVGAFRGVLMDLRVG